MFSSDNRPCYRSGLLVRCTLLNKELHVVSPPRVWRSSQSRNLEHFGTGLACHLSHSVYCPSHQEELRFFHVACMDNMSAKPDKFQVSRLISDNEMRFCSPKFHGPAYGTLVYLSSFPIFSTGSDTTRLFRRKWYPFGNRLRGCSDGCCLDTKAIR